MVLSEPERVRLRVDEFRVLHLEVEGRTFDDVTPVRLFPISGKADYVSFVDKEGREVALLAHPHGLDKASRKTLADSLDRMYYMPRIVRVDTIKETWGVTHWEVQTDRGYATFEVVDRERIRKLSHGRFIIQDADGSRFEIEDVSALDPRSQALIQSET